MSIINKGEESAESVDSVGVDFLKVSNWRLITNSDSILLCVSLIAGSSFLAIILMEPKWSSASSTSQAASAKIGTVNFVENDVRIRAEHSLGWETLEDRQNIYENDSIFTGAYSGARVLLQKYGEISMNANSLVVFNFASDRIRLDLKLGDMTVEINPESRLSVIHNNQQIDLMTNVSGKVTFKRHGANSLKVNSTVNNLKITAGTQAQEVSINEEIIFYEAEKVQKRKLSFLPVKPGLNEHILVEKNQNLAFSWLKTGEPAQTDEFFFQLSDHTEFEKLLVDQQVVDDKINLVAPQKDGIYFWRIFNKKNKTTLCANYYFRLTHVDVPVLMSPAPESNIRIMERGPIFFTWHYSQEFGRFQFQLSQDKDFLQPLFEKTLNRKALSLDKLSDGKYFWRVRFEKSWIQSPMRWSAVNAFVITNQKDLQPSVVVAQSTYMPTPSLNPSLSQALTPTPTPIFTSTLTETPTPVAPNIPSKKVVDTVSLTSTEIKTLGKKSNYPQQSEKVNFAAPVLSTVADIDFKSNELSKLNEPISYEIKWHHDQETARFKLITKFDLDKSEKVTFIENAHSYSLKIDVDGIYHLKIAVCNGKGEQLSPFSNVVQFKVKRNLSIDTPKTLAPLDQLKIVQLGDQGNPIIFTWHWVENAETYELEVASDPEYKNIVVRRTSTNTKLLLNEKFKAQTFYWHLRAHNKSWHSDWTQTRSFTLKDGG
jgi:hypothetical protein